LGKFKEARLGPAQKLFGVLIHYCTNSILVF